MSRDAIYEVTVALSERLRDAAGSTFIGPLDDPNVSTAKLILFLYRIAPNPSLRNRAHRVPSNPLPPPNTPPPAITFTNSLPLDLYYLVTVGTNPGGSEEGMLKSLGAAMQSMQLDPELLGPTLGHEGVHVTLDPLTTEEISRIWALFPTANYRTSIGYLASPVWLDPLVPEVSGARVVIDRLDAGARAAMPVE